MILFLTAIGCSPEGASNAVITPTGFQFLLLDTPSQVWFFMLQYLETAQARRLDIVDALSFLFQLSFSTLGKVSNKYS